MTGPTSLQTGSPRPGRGWGWGTGGAQTLHRAQRSFTRQWPHMVAVPERTDCTLQCPPHVGPAAGAARTNPGPERQAGALVKADSPAQNPPGGNTPQRRVKAEPRSEAELGHSCTGPHPCPGLRHQPHLTSMCPSPRHIGQQVCEEQRAPPPHRAPTQVGLRGPAPDHGPQHRPGRHGDPGPSLRLQL